MWKRLLLSLVALWAVPPSSDACAAEAVRLVEWDQPAVLHNAGGPGRDSFELTAIAEWSRGATGPYALRIVMPGGAVEQQVLRVENGRYPRRVSCYVPASAVRNLRPSSVVVRVSVVDAATNAEVGNALQATIDDFPHPRPEVSQEPDLPFGWGAPLSGANRLLPRAGPDGFHYVRISDGGAGPAAFLATTEASNAQVARRLPGYDPRAGRSDEFLLEDASQPALGLSARQAESYLAALGKADPSGVAYRLPAAEQWLRAARAGRSSAYWWGDEPLYPAGANFLGPEPGLETDATAPTEAGPGAPRFRANPWGLRHTFGNVAEWATLPGGGFARMGGHFRSEAKAPAQVPVADAQTTGPDPYVGVRPSFVLDAATVTALARRALATDPKLAALRVGYEPGRSTATLEGTLPEPALRHLADRKLASLWFLAAVDNRVATPALAPGQLARLGAVAGPVRRITPLGRWHYEVPVEVRWNDPLPVSGSEWWVNLYLPGGGHAAHRMVEREPDRSRRLTVVIDRSRMSAAGLPVDAPISVALSLGAAAEHPSDPRVVSNVAPLRWKVE